MRIQNEAIYGKPIRRLTEQPTN